MSLPDTIFIFALALVIFGPKKLPEIGRQLGKLVLEFRRASNEFKMQIEEELRSGEEADRQKKIAAESAAATATVTNPEALTIRPPSSGTTESTESPFRAYSEYGDTAEPAVEPEIAGPESPEQEAPSAEPTASITNGHEGTLGDYERTVSGQEKIATDGEGLEEQTTHHHA